MNVDTDVLAIGIDLETTGLTDSGPGGLYRGGRILEIGLMLVRPDLSVPATFQSAVRPDVPVGLLRDECKPVVREMHDASGLWAECETASPLRDLVVDALSWLAGHGVQRGELPLFGSSVHTDREWLKHGNAAELEAYAHYRNIDVSSVRELAACWYPGWVPDTRPRKAHRAVSDLQDTLGELRCYRDHLFRAAPRDVAAELDVEEEQAFMSMGGQQ